ncbi:MAG TPA: MotA/TolQ/ExbB proton channel family protein [Armatimonadota bacterium]|jgi:chemotaxis protein MotA
MDPATIIGLIVGIGGVLLSVIVEGGSLRSMVQVPAAIIVFAGTYGAAIACVGVSTFLGSFPAAVRAVLGRTPNRSALVEELVELGTRARREGLLALEADLEKIDHPMLHKALQLVIDGSDPEMVEEILDTELRAREAQAKRQAGFFVTWAGLGPTLGVTGTVMGLVNMMGKLNNPSEMGPAIAGAFCATLYGVATANLLYMPLGKKLMLIADEEKVVGEMIIEGVRAVQEGASPLALRQRLSAYLGQSAGKAAGKSADSPSSPSEESARKAA